MTRPRRVLLAAVLAVAVGGSAAACLRPGGDAHGPTPSSSPTSPAAPSQGSPAPAPAPPPSSGNGDWSGFRVTGSQWTSWRPTLGAVQPAHEDDLARLARRSRAVLDREFTATVEAPFGEYTLARSRTRSHVRFGPRDRPVLDVYADQAALAHPDPQRLVVTPLTVCPHAEKSCFAVTGTEPAGDRPHLFDTITDSLVYLASAAMTAQARGPAFLDSVRGQGLGLGLTTVDSPLGRLECVVVAEQPGDLPGLSGTPVSPGDRDATHGELCLDSRGLVVLSPGDLLSPLTSYTALDTAVPTGLSSYPYPVRPYPS